MTTSMHRLQISLPEQQVRYLTERGRREGLSMAEVIRRLIEREATAVDYRVSAGGEGISVAERGESYMTAAGRGAVASLTLNLPPELYGRLQAEARSTGRSLPGMAQDWLAERLAAQPAPVLDERERVTQALRAAGLLVELDPQLKARADPTISLEKVQAALDRAGGKLLSEIILAQRGPKG